MNRFAKQLIYGGGFLLIMGGILWLGYRQVSPAAICTDGVQNGREEGLDCGPVCGKLCAPTVQSLKNDGVQIVHYANDGYDAVVHLENPNTSYGASRASYTLTVSDAAGKALIQRTGTTYVNPAESRYLVFPLIGISGQPASAQLQLVPTQVQWGALSGGQTAAVQFTIRNEQLLSTSGSFRYQGAVTNHSNFDFGQVDVVVLLSDSGGRLIGSGSTVLSSVVAKEERAFTIDWPFAIPGVVRAQVLVTTNVFDNANYIRTYGSPNATPQP